MKDLATEIEQAITAYTDAWFETRWLARKIGWNQATFTPLRKVLNHLVRTGTLVRIRHGLYMKSNDQEI